MLKLRKHCCEPQSRSDSQSIPIKIPYDDPVRRFSDIRCLNLTRPITYQSTGCLASGTIPQRKVELLRDLYEHVEDIDLMAGTWVEKPVRGGFAPPTFYYLVVKQYLHNMLSDRHWYERPNRPNAFSLSQLLEVRKASISRILCDVGDKVTRIQRRGFERIGPKNIIISCKEIREIDFTHSLWKDDACSAYKLI